jgi:DNA-binding SARP family transcriptional activator
VADAEALDDAQQAAIVIGEALKLVRGAPLTGVGLSFPWVGEERGIVEAQILDAAEELAEVCLATGDWRGAQRAARRGLLALKADERMYRLLMRAEHAAGNIAGIQRIVDELVDAVADPKSGTEPEDTIHPETWELIEELTGTRGRRRKTA